jgi:hypothetical protein
MRDNSYRGAFLPSTKRRAESLQPTEQLITTRHTRWVRISHWMGTVGFLTPAFTGVFILMVHPRLYWGEVGNDLNPALIELPIAANRSENLLLSLSLRVLLSPDYESVSLKICKRSYNRRSLIIRLQ